MKPETTRKTVFDFSDYRSFLVNYANEMKSSSSHWSLGVWSKKLGVANTASLSRILKGDRAPGVELIEKFVEYFGFNQKQAEYFRHLVNIQKQKRNVAVRMLLMNRLKFLHPEKNFIELDHKVFQTISNWYYSFLREFTNLHSSLSNRTLDTSALAQITPFDLSQRDIDQAFQVLLDLKLVEQDSVTGGFRATDVTVDTKPDVSSEGIRTYFEQNLENAKKAIRKVATEEREFFSLSFCMPQSRMAEAKAALRDFRKEFLERFEAKPGEADQVYQFQVQLFPYLNHKSNNKEK